MLTRIAGGRIVDPANTRDAVGDIHLRDGRIVAAPPGGEADETYDVSGMIVMAGAIDIHSHIAGSNENTGRLLLPEQRYADEPVHPGHLPQPRGAWNTVEIGRRYAAMGFTTVVEPAVLPHHALQTHLELADIPMIDKATLTVLGNDDFLLDLLRRRESAAALRDYVAWTLATSRGLGIKVINAGGAEAFKHNLRRFSLDDEVPGYGVSSRAIVKALQSAVQELALPHRLHVHCNNLGLAGNVETAIATIAAAEDTPLHLAHLQFYAYGTEGKRGFSSAAARLAAAVNAAKSVTVDVGQVMFGQTVTISCDVLRQFNARTQARPKKWVIFDGDASGAGIVPYEYRARNFHNAIQWAAGLELFLLTNDPWRVFLTTDHPNGAPFTSYPDILALLMNRELRTEWMGTMPKEAIEVTTLPSITREYTLEEVATMTRAAPARLLGLADRGHLGVGALADIAVYAPDRDIARMFRAAALVFKNGELVVRDGTVLRQTLGRTLTATATLERTIERRMRDYYEQRYGLSPDCLAVPAAAIGPGEPFESVPCRS
ncbi:MAG: formylmethanofuran dehydrogenase subunit A [Alphaproteobacteria bacterium]|nr:formylmethanofuran dehydrogenase subunit A [Alphaproteobacteria bacterium]